MLFHEVQGLLAGVQLLVDLGLGGQEGGLRAHQVLAELVGHD